MKTLNKIVSIFLIISFFPLGALAANTSGTFRGKWWNYYDRGIEYSESGQFEDALSDIQRAMSARGKDQRMARTYGMHFIDYFPHRELGIIYFNKGNIDMAISELEESIRSTESAKAVYYLNKARRAKIQLQKGSSLLPPSLKIDSPSENLVVRSMTASVKGKATGEGLISRITINNRPYRFEMADRSISFESDVEVSDGENTINVRCEDLLGNIAERSIKVIVDREGPTINIYDILEETGQAGKQIRITGEVNDDTGINKVMLNGSQAKGENKNSYEFNVTVPSGAGKFIVEAFDIVDNATRAEIDLAKELAAFNRKPEWVMLAFNGNKLFSQDKEPPVVRLKDTTEIPTVFVDKYYVEGEAYDNKRVVNIKVNNVDIPAKQGKKIYFSRTISLKEGQNRITVDVYDGSDNKGSAGFNVTRYVPDVLQNSSRLSVSVMPFDTKQKASDLSELAYDHLIGAFVDQKRFNVIERSKLEAVLLEQKLTKAKLTDQANSIKVGKLMSAETILATSIRETATSVEIISRVINTETSEVMDVKDVFSEDRSFSAIKDLMDGLAYKVASGFPLVEGIVIKQDNKEVYSDIGDSANIKKNTGVIIYRKGKEIKHPITGKSLGWDTIKLAEGRFEEIQKDFSKITLIDKSIKGNIAVKDLIMTK